MTDAILLPELISRSATREPDAIALTHGQRSISYGLLQQSLSRFSGGLINLGMQRGERIGIYLEKRLETVVASFGTAAAGCVFVPLNPLLKADQVAHIMRDCNVRALVTSSERLSLLAPILASCHDLRQVILVNSDRLPSGDGPLAYLHWDDLLQTGIRSGHRVIDTDMAAILYTSGSTGKPKGVVLSHRNIVAGAISVASYLENSAEDTLLAALPLSFDAGFSQLTTAFHAGARVVLLNYLLPQDVLKALAAEKVTGLTAVPPLYIQLSQLEWPLAIGQHLRYFANTGGRMPRDTLAALRARLPNSRPYLMYGLTEAFRSTYLPPEEVDRRPDSIGKAIPYAEILVVREDGSACAPGEPGELVHRGSLVGLGYWNDPVKTAERYKPAPGQPAGLVNPELAVWSGDTVRMDEDGYLYFIGRRDDMIKTSGYRVSPTEVEEVLYGSGLVAEAAAIGVAHGTLGQAVVAVIQPAADAPADDEALLAHCKRVLPNFMVPLCFVRRAALPRNPNGKIDRKQLAGELETLYAETGA